jgi:hypothetical protein
MARRKTLPESVRAKHALAERLAALRCELFGERGGPEMARRLGIPVRTWYNYEGGVTVPAEVILRIIELTSVEATWLLSGQGEKFRHSRPARVDGQGASSMTIGALLRTALQLLEKDRQPASLEKADQLEGELDPVAKLSSSDREQAKRHFRSSNGVSGVVDDGQTRPAEPAHSSVLGWRVGELEEAERENRCLRVEGDAMAPIVADGAIVAFARNEEDPGHLDGKMIVAWLDDRPVVRWFQNCGRFALLRAENPATTPQQVLVNLEDPRHRPRFRRVLWINTPH